MKTLLILVALSLFVGLGVAQGPAPGPGHIGTGSEGRVLVEAAPYVCWFAGPERSNITIVCFNGPSPFPMIATAVTVLPGQVVSGNDGGISWSLSEPALGEFDWNITATTSSGTATQSGTF